MALTSNAPIERVSASGNRAVALDGVGKVHLFDLSSSTNPRLLGTWEPLFLPSDAKVLGDLVYVASYEPDFLSTIEIVDFSNPTQPVLRGYYDTPGHAVELAVQGTTVCVADWEQGLLILDASDQTRPRRIGGFDTLGHVSGVHVSGRYAYVADGNWLVMLDISDPSNPWRVGLFEAGSAIRTMEARGLRLYLAEESGDLRILDVSEPRNTQVLGSYRGWGSAPMGVAATGSFAYLARGEAGLQVINVSNPTNAVWQTGTGWGSSAMDVALAGNRILVAGGQQGLLVYELQRTLHPPLKPPVMAGGTMTFSWPPMDGVRLQKSTNLAAGTWVDVPGSDLTNLVILPSTELSAFYRLAQGPKGAPVPEGCVAWWRGDGDARDSIGENRGELRNGVTFEPGVVGQAFSFDGESGDVLIQPASSLDIGAAESFTIEAWILPRGPAAGASGSGPIVEWDDGTHFWVHNSPFELFINLAADPVSLGPTFAVPGISQESWNHVVATYSSMTGIVALYVDGAEVGSKSEGSVIPRTTTPLHIGRRRNEGFFGIGPITSFKGLIDEVRLYNRALTADEIRANYEAGSAGMLKPVR